MNSKKIVTLFLSFLLLLAQGCYAEEPQNIVPKAQVAPSPVDPTVAAVPVTGQWSDGWYQDADGYDKAVQEYKQTHKPMLVYMSVAWCPYCRRIEKGVLSSPAVQAFLKDKIKVRVNPESGARENELASEYRIRGFPSLFLHPPQPGRPLQFPTDVAPEEFIELFQRSVQ